MRDGVQCMQCTGVNGGEDPANCCAPRRLLLRGPPCRAMVTRVRRGAL